MQINLSLISSSLHNITELSQKRMEVIEALKALGDVSIFKNSSPASCGIESATGEIVNVAYILTGGTESLFIKLFGENCSRLGNNNNLRCISQLACRIARDMHLALQ